MRYLVKLPDEERARWAERRQPAPGRRTKWWLGLFEHCLVRISGREPKLEPDGYGSRCGYPGTARHPAPSRASKPQRLARLVVELRIRGHADELSGTLPSADEIVLACLDALPVMRTAVPTRDTTGFAPLCRSGMTRGGCAGNPWGDRRLEGPPRPVSRSNA